MTGDGRQIATAENVAIEKAKGAYYVVVSPYTTLGPQNYSASANLVTRQGPSLAQLERSVPAGVPNHRASRDKYTSHSEPTIAMDPLDHNHLMAGSEMYENNDKYLFKVGTYGSRDGGRTWDDEGNAYADVLDAPGGTAGFQGFNMTVHVKQPGMLWSGPTTVHDNRVNKLTTQLLLDDKNWLAVDNHTDVNGAIFGVRRGKVTFVAVADRVLVRNRKALRTQLASAVLIRNR